MNQADQIGPQKMTCHWSGITMWVIDYVKQKYSRCMRKFFIMSKSLVEHSSNELINSALMMIC